MRWLVWAVFALGAFPVVAYFALLAYLALFVNPGHANEYFEDKFEVEAVLASRRWHRLGAEPWDCTFAIVQIAADLPTHPPETWQGDWNPTPAAPLGDTTRDAVSSCQHYWSDDVLSWLVRALTEPGSFYARDGVGENLFIYAPSHRIAARIRYGD